jgi:hypothetical protein
VREVAERSVRAVERVDPWPGAPRGEFRVGYDFGPRYSYVDVNALPHPIVTQYHLGTNFRYVDRDGYVYVVNPSTYRVVRIHDSVIASGSGREAAASITGGVAVW